MIFLYRITLQENVSEKVQYSNFLFRIRDKELSIDGQEPHLGHEGKYRRTSSPSVCNAPNVKPSVAAMNANKSQVKTPKRDSPATIAAKGEFIYFFQN